MSLYSARNIPLYAVVVAPILVVESADFIRGNPTSIIAEKFNAFQSRLVDVEKYLRGGFWSSLVILVILILLLNGFSLDFQNKGNQFLDDVFPVEAVDWIKEKNIDGNGFNYFPWGGYLLYRIWPDKLVFIDGQTDFYGEMLTRQYEQVITLSPGWEEVLREYQINWVLMPTQSKLVEHLQILEDWDTVYRDHVSTIMLLEIEN